MVPPNGGYVSNQRPSQWWEGPLKPMVPPTLRP